MPCAFKAVPRRGFQSAGKPAQICDRTGAPLAPVASCDYVARHTTHTHIWEGLRRLYLAIRMGRNPWKSQQQTFTGATVEDAPAYKWVGAETLGALFVVERIRGVESKYNEQGGVLNHRNSIQTTLPADSPKIKHTHKPHCERRNPLLTRRW